MEQKIKISINILLKILYSLYFLLVVIIKINADTIIGTVITKKEALVPKPQPMKKEAKIRKLKRFFSKLIQYIYVE